MKGTEFLGYALRGAPLSRADGVRPNGVEVAKGNRFQARSLTPLRG